MDAKNRLPRHKLMVILMRLELGYSVRAIEREIGVCRRTIRRLRINLQTYGTPYPPTSPCVQGAPKSLSHYQELVSVDFLVLIYL
jgi:transposase-like protein